MSQLARFALVFPLFTSGMLAADFLPKVHRIVFLGDSITYAGNYVDQFEAFVALRYPDRQFDVIDVGLPSETVSGLSEPGHAGGKFPRPDLHERLDRVLAKTKPDLVIACYGMNDGIYQPLAEERFAKYREGIEKLRQKVHAAGAEIIHLTPPVFDAEPIKAKTDPTGSQPDKMYTGYDEVLAKYAEWLLSKRADGWRVIDIHQVMRNILNARRAADPQFAFAKDGVHPNEAGHWVISMALIGDLSGADRAEAMTLMNRMGEPGFAPDFMGAIRQRGRIRCDAWLTDTGHKRPGMKEGLPIAEAEAKAKELQTRIAKQAQALGTSAGNRPL